MKMLRLGKIKAKIYKTFITDCPRCHEYFYGYQDYGVHVIMKNKNQILKNYRYVCHKCHNENKTKARVA